MAHLVKTQKPYSRAPVPKQRFGLAGRTLAQGTHQRRCPACHADSGTIEKPADVVDFSKLISSVKKRPPYYKVMLHNDNVNRREYVVQALLKVVDGLTMEDALEVMHEAHLNDIALVIVSPQEQAEEYVTGLRRNGLTSTMEPGSGGGSSPGGDSEQ